MIKLGVPEGFQPHWKDNLSNEQYHADREFTSSSALKGIINESPAYFLDSLFSPQVKKNTSSMLLSTLVHHAVLEGDDFIKRYQIMPSFAVYGRANSNKHKEAKAAWLLEHKDRIIVTEEDLKVLEGTYESIFNHPDAALILKGSKFERSGYYVDPASGVRCRIRYDSYHKSGGILSDIKAVRSCKSKDFPFAIRDYRWDLSMAMYSDGIQAIDGKAPDDCVFIAVEKTRPYSCAVYPIGYRTMSIGLSDYRKALDVLSGCVKTGQWPSYQQRMEEIDLPSSFMKGYGL